MPGRSRNEPAYFECQDHLMYGWRRDSEVLLHFGLSGRASMDFAVVMDEDQVLALFFRVCFLHSYDSITLWGIVVARDYQSLRLR